MKSFPLSLLLAGLVALATPPSAPPALAQWGAGGCFYPQGPVGPSVFTQPVYQPAYSWEQRPDGWHYLLYGNAWQGAYHPERGYFPLFAGAWSSEPGICPVGFPVPMIEQKEVIGQPWETQGVDTSKLSGDLIFTRKGQQITEKECFQAVLQTGPLTDDSMKPCMIVVGKDDDRKKVLDTINGSARLKDALKAWKVYYYKPDHHHLRGWKQKKDGSPWIFWQRPKKLDHGNADVVWEITKLESEQQLFEAVDAATKRLDPEFRPTPPPLPNFPQPGPLPPLTIDLTAALPLLLVILVAGGLYLLPNRKEQ